MPLTAHAAGRSLEERLWRLLPGRADRSRVTTPTVLAAVLGEAPERVMVCLHAMEQAGSAIRDRKTGTRASSWHRGLPPHAPAGCRDSQEQQTGPQAGLW